MSKLWESNKTGFLAIIFSGIGVITTIIPFLGFIAFFTLPTGLVLGIISLAKKNQPKWLGITSVIASSVSIFINAIFWIFIFIAFLSFIAGSFQA